MVTVPPRLYDSQLAIPVPVVSVPPLSCTFPKALLLLRLGSNVTRPPALITIVSGRLVVPPASTLPAPNRSVPPLLIVTVRPAMLLLPRLDDEPVPPPLFICKVPPLTVTLPVNVFRAESVVMPGPLLARPVSGWPLRWASRVETLSVSPAPMLNTVLPAWLSAALPPVI